MMRLTPLAVPIALALVGCQEYDFVQDLPDWGNSIAPPVEGIEHTDEIMQVQTPQVDILWTIDNSCSMADEQNELTENFPFFMDYFLGSGLDYHVGVTSTDIDRPSQGGDGIDGSLRQVAGQLWIETDTDDPIQVFSAMATLGTMGSGAEKGLGGTYKCLEVKRDTANAGFYRDDAAMHTIIISDEPDYTPDSLISQGEFIDWYDGLKDDTDMRSFSAIVSFQVGTSYMNVAQNIGGIVWDITQDDWPQLLERLGVQAAGLKREYYLSHLPVPGTIEVSVLDSETGSEHSFLEAPIDEETGDPVDLDGDGLPDGDWTYDPTRNSITFVEYIPNSLSTVLIHYTLLAAQQGQTDSF